MFELLSGKFEEILGKLKGKGKLSEDNIQEALRQVKRSLLEADVNYKIVKNFIAEIEKRAVGQEVLKSLNPYQQVIKIVNEQLVALMGEKNYDLKFINNKVNKIMLVGLQGSGKTTTCAKLANHYRKKNYNPLLVACDIHRPAAIEQLKVLGKQLNINVISDESKNLNKIVKTALSFAEKNMNNLVIFDTAGRLHIDQDMMEEITKLKKQIEPDYIIFVADSMTGQEAVNIADVFNKQLSLDGIILSKFDGDAKGGAALSIKAIIGKPILFVGMGEKISDLEIFHPDRIASRILGMGDVLSLIEKAQENVDKDEAEKLAQRMLKNQFTFNDFLKQLNQVKKMGPLSQVLKMIPGVNSSMLENANLDGKELKHIEAIIYSMTPKERENPKLINGERRKRIAGGSGTSVQKINQLLNQFEQMKKMMKQFSSGKLNMKNLKNSFKGF